MPANSVGTKHFDFQNFGNMTLSSITTTTDSNVTSPKVIVLNTDNSDEYYYKDTVVNTRGFADSGRWQINSNGVNNLTELIEVESQGLKKNMKSMYYISWIQTPQIMDIIQNIINHLSGNASTMLLKQLALETNSAFEDFLKNHTMNTFNLVTMDWYDISSTTNPVNMIIGLN
jgi:neutral trehalase